MDEALVCNMSTAVFKVDTTPPTAGKVRIGPDFDMVLMEFIEAVQ